MSRFLIVALLTSACWMGSGKVASAQYRARTHTGHLAVGPMGGISTGQTRTTAHAGPLGSSSTRVHTGTTVTPGGVTIQHGQAAGARSGPLGASAGSAKGVRVTTPSGQTYTHTSTGKVAAGPGGVAASGSSRSTVAGPFGAAGVRRAGGVVIR